MASSFGCREKGNRFAKPCSGVSVTVAANELPMSFAHLSSYDTRRDAATSFPLAKPCSGVSVTVAADEMPKSFAHLSSYDTHRDAATSFSMAKHCSGVSVTVAANELPKSFALLSSYDTYRDAATSFPLAKHCSGVSVTVAAIWQPSAHYPYPTIPRALHRAEVFHTIGAEEVKPMQSVEILDSCGATLRSANKRVYQERSPAPPLRADKRADRAGSALPSKPPHGSFARVVRPRVFISPSSFSNFGMARPFSRKRRAVLGSSIRA